MQNTRHWHLLMTKPRDDARAEQHLLNQDYEIFRPLLKRLRLRRGRQTAVVESLFPRYIFIRLDEAVSNWAKLHSTRGVAGLVRFSELPARVPEDLVSALMSRADGDGIIDDTLQAPSLFQPGEEVTITGGSFRGLQAIVKAQSSEERVVILLDMLGKTQTLEMSISHLERMAFQRQVGG